MLLLTARQHAGESRPCMGRLAGCVWRNDSVQMDGRWFSSKWL